MNEINTTESKVEVSNNVRRAMAALILTEVSFKERLKERELTKDSGAYKEFQKEYNNASNLKLELVAKYQVGGKSAATIHYSNPDKHKGRIVGEIKEDTVLWLAMEQIRFERTSAFLKSKNENLLPCEVSLTDSQWCALALALHSVPSVYKITTDAGNRAHNKDTAAAWLKEFKEEILNDRQEVRLTASESMEDQTFINLPESVTTEVKPKAAKKSKAA